MIYDVIGVGFGPSNIALAIAMEELGYRGQALFLERHHESRWHEGMLLEGSDIQNNLLRDLVTPASPLSRFSFVNYLHQSGRFFHYLNLGRSFPLRRDFFDYVRWAANHFENVRYSAAVSRLRMVPLSGGTVWEVTTSDGTTRLARNLVLGTGRNLNIPDGLEECENIAHLVHYLPAVERLDRAAPVAVLGSSQSAVEILLDLMSKGFQAIRSIHRTFSYRLKDTSPFSDEVYFPEFIDYYHALPPDKRRALDSQVRQTNYSCADRDIIDSLYTRLYEERLDGKNRVEIIRNHEIVAVHKGERLTLSCRDVYTGAMRNVDAALLVLATGFLDVGRNGRAGLPKLLQHLADDFSWTENYLNVERDYRVRYAEPARRLPALYLNGLCESSHGMGDAGSFSLVSIRARDILTSLSAQWESHESSIHDLRHPEEALRSRGSAGVR